MSQEIVDAVLEGGPGDFPEDARHRRAAPEQYTIKVMHRGGYEHFEWVSDPASRIEAAPRVYRWTSRTRIAE